MRRSTPCERRTSVPDRTGRAATEIDAPRRPGTRRDHVYFADECKPDHRPRKLVRCNSRPGVGASRQILARGVLPRPAAGAIRAAEPCRNSRPSPPSIWDPIRFTCKSPRSEEHTSELQSQFHLVCRLLLEKKTT